MSLRSSGLHRRIRSASHGAHPALQQLVLLPGAIAQRLVPIAREIVVTDRAVELTHREVDAPAIDPVVEMPGAVDIGLQDLAAEFVMNDERRHAALAGCRVVEPPAAAGLDRPRPPELLIEIDEERAPCGHCHLEFGRLCSSKIRLANDTRHPCSPGERSDPGDRGNKTTGYSILLAPPPD